MFGFTLGQNLKDMTHSVVIGAIKKTNRIFISDTTLRDGEQAPGAGLSAQQKLTIAKQLDKLGVDTIEAGFPASSGEEYKAVQAIAKEIKRPAISALSRCRAEDIDVAAEALKEARQWGIALFIGTSPMLRKHSLNDKSQDDIIKTVKESVKRARKHTTIVGFGPEDATRTEPEFLYRVCEAAIESGAIVIGIPDTVGKLVPAETAELMENVKTNVGNISQALLAVHFHNDLGLAVANALAAIEHGANVVQCTVNGLGERAGNTSLEELVMALKIRTDKYKVSTGVNPKELFNTSRLVAELTGVKISLHKPIVGENVFATEAGIHQAALLKDISTYQIIKPEDVGQKGTTYVLGRHSGKSIVIHKLDKLGYKVSKESNKDKLDAIYSKFMDLALTKKRVEDSELAQIAKAVMQDKR